VGDREREEGRGVGGTLKRNDVDLSASPSLGVSTSERLGAFGSSRYLGRSRLNISGGFAERFRRRHIFVSLVTRL
jgi:hypothetical protein